jgi:hypothetical protein
MVVPKSSAREPAAAELVGAAAGAGPSRPRPAAIAPQRQPAPPAHRGMNWREAVTSQLALKPITEDMLPAVRARPQPKPEPEEREPNYKLKSVTKDSLPALGHKEPEFEKARPGSVYQMVIPRELQKEMAARNRGPSAVQKGYAQGVHSYRKFFNTLAKLSGWISNTSYTVSFVFLLLAIAGGMINRHSLAVFALSAIVIFNLVGLAGDLVNLVMLSFRKNPIQGVLFLIPPVTLIYLLTDWRRYRETVNRMMVPVFMLCLVLAAYTFIPWLQGDKPSQKTPGTLGERINKAAESIKRDVGGSASRALQTAGEAKDAVGEGADETKKKLGGAAPPAPAPATGGSKADGAEKPAQNRDP